MPTFSTSLLEGQNLSELNQMAADGDPRHLGTVFRNVQLIAINERAAAETRAALDAGRAAEERELAAHSAEMTAEASREAYARDRDEAIRRSGYKRLSKAQRIALEPDSDEAVDQFLGSLR
jgi:hypothetical protein